MKIIKRTFSVLLAFVMMLSLFAVNGSAASIRKIEIVELPDKTTFVKGTDWDYGFWQYPEGDGYGKFVKSEGIISFLHRGGYFSYYQDRGMLDMNGLVVKVTYSDGKTKNIAYKETLHSNGVVEQNIYASPKGGEYKLGENTVEIYFLENYNVYTTYKINIVDVKKGDVNSDGKINSTDALIVLNYSVQNLKLNEQQKLAADMNGDSKINSIDALKILRKSVGIE
ncbi:MAG: dockerin type I repeat-containing protein [Clostridia bacterium]|nr:dockerin type I repeat-containing protein [Clostridia bacterium]